MRIVQILPLLVASILAYFVLYAPQPLFPLLSISLGLSETQTGLLTTATMLPLFIAPLTFGRLLSKYSPERLLRISLLLLALTTTGFVLANDFTLLLVIRFCQGLLLPVLLTSVMTLTSRCAGPTSIKQAMSAYVTATILGGLFGRLISGFFADYSDWRYFFYLLSVLLVVMACAPFGRENTSAVQDDQINWHDIKVLLFDRGLGYVFLAVSCLFFIFSAMMNFLPFRVSDLNSEASGIFISLMYSGYLLGVVTSLLSSKLSILGGGDHRTLMIGFIIYTLAIAMTVFNDINILFISLFVFCGAMFLVHSIAAAWVNTVAGEKRRLVNALYLTFYYLGGVLGSVLPGLVYEWFGWNYFVVVLILAAAIGLMSISKIKIN
ncbi:MFS transporter [Alkalimarinus alittae]|uniref:MFS transporter n=1 Tax=Alkalimarinus alittae TaxID=2961619 RepID=A0ABY6N5S6_9ALTE|nr:MFS transporter [Alkalimarinus alittae]UZE97390.1 MFS transporter [Alkalimarinus alittae]